MLRDYQQEMLDRLERTWRKHRSVLVQMPTGTGKTVLLAEELRREEQRMTPASQILVVAHRRELIAQIRQTIAALGIEGDDIVVESIQKLARGGYPTPNPSPKKGGEFSPSLVVIDEAHHALAKTYRMLWERWPKAKFLGLTATPCRLGGDGFTDLFDVLLQSWPIQEFIDKGWLSDFEYVSARPDSRMVRQVRLLKKRSAGDYQETEMATVLDVPESIAHLYETYRQFAWGKKGIVYAINRQHAEHIAKYYREQGVSCAVIDSKTPAKERERLVEAYRGQSEETKIDVLVNVDIFGEGFDVPEVEFIQLARPTLSLSKYLQQVGRGMRVSKGKPHVTILDQVGLYQTFGLPTDSRDWERMFQGKASGKGETDVVRGLVVQDEENDRTLANLEMVRIKRRGERHTGLEIFMQNGKFGVMRNGRVSCPAKFKRIERLSKESGFYALGIYNILQWEKVEEATSVIDSKGVDLKIKLLGKVEWNGEYFFGMVKFYNQTNFVNCWDPVGKSYYDQLPDFERIAGVEIAAAREHGSYSSDDYCRKLRYSTGKVSPRFQVWEMFYNRYIIIARDYLVVKNDHNHAYRICGYVGDSIVVQSENSYGFMKIGPDGKKGVALSSTPPGMTKVFDSRLLGLKRVVQ